MIQVHDIVKSFDGFKALNGLSMSVPAGSVYGLVGPNGSGKSTLIRHITGIYRQDSGEVLVDGQPIFENVAVKSRISYIPDDVFYFLQASITDMMRYYRGIYPKFSTERFNRLRGAFSLDEKQPMRRMSKGQQKQAAFWLCMSACPEILVLDEPVDGLDPVMRRQIWSIIMADVTEHGTTVLVSSHNLRELEDVCDHVGIIDKGQLLIERSLSQLQENISKIQVALPDGGDLPEGLNIIHRSKSGRLQTVIVRGDPNQVMAQIQQSQPLFADALPLSLEEIFIYELGGHDYEVKDIIL
jgi:ABC-2 type transport system ATP-binding protein